MREIRKSGWMACICKTFSSFDIIDGTDLQEDSRRYNLDTRVLISHGWYIHNIVYSKLIIETYKKKFLVAESSLLIPFDIRRFDNIHTIHT